MNELVSSLKGNSRPFAFPLNAVADDAPTRPSQPNVPGNSGQLANCTAAQDDWRHSLVLVATPRPPAPIPPMSTLDAVLSALDSVIEWSIETSSRLGVFRRAVQADNDRRGCRGDEDSGWLAAPGHPGANIMNVTSADVVLGYLSAEFSYPIDPRCGQALFVRHCHVGECRRPGRIGGVSTATASYKGHRYPVESAAADALWWSALSACFTRTGCPSAVAVWNRAGKGSRRTLDHAQLGIAASSHRSIPAGGQ